MEWDHTIYHAWGGTHIDPLHRACHRTKTTGIPHIPMSGDISKIAKVKRLASKTDEHTEAMRRKLLATTPKEERKSRWPKRPFPKRTR